MSVSKLMKAFTKEEVDVLSKRTTFNEYIKQKIDARDSRQVYSSS